MSSTEGNKANGVVFLLFNSTHLAYTETCRTILLFYTLFSVLSLLKVRKKFKDICLIDFDGSSIVYI